MKQVRDLDESSQAWLAVQHVHCSLLTLRRCLQGVAHRDQNGARTELGHCQRPATLYESVDATQSYYSCDACAAVFGQKGMSELPHADVVRRYHARVATPSSIEKWEPKDALRLARDLVAALPPCPNARIDWQHLDTIAEAPNRHFLRPQQLATLARSAVEVHGDRDGSCVRCENVIVTPRPLVDLDNFLRDVGSTE